MLDRKSIQKIQLHIVKSDTLLSKADIFKKLLVGDSVLSNKSSPSLIPHINRLICKSKTIAIQTVPGGVNISELIDARTSYFSNFQVDHIPVYT